MLELPFEPAVEQILLPAFNKNDVEVFLKRDDMIHPFISGNKWRKLKYVLKDALDKNKKHLVSFGGPYSNHLLALACAGAMYDFKTTAFVRGEKVQNQTLGLCELYGMNLVFVTRDSYKDKTKLYLDFSLTEPQTYFIDEGGKGELATKGCEEILNTIEQGFTHVICAVGTGTTLAGIAKAAKTKDMIAEGICVLKGAEEMSREINELSNSEVKVHYNFHRGGYAKTDEGLMLFIKNFAQQTGILLDQVYTGKMMMGIEQLIEEKYFEPESKILAVHTGGLLGMMSLL